MSTIAARVEGRLDIHLSLLKGEATIQSSRPLLASRLFEGKSVDDTLQLIPLLFNVCGQAQQTVAVRAIESARGFAASVQVEQARELLVQLETLREHLWRVLLDWPRFYGGTPASHPLSLLMEEIQAAREAIDPHRKLCRQPGLQNPLTADNALILSWKQLSRRVADQVFAGDPAQWLEHDAKSFRHWMQHTDTPAAKLLRFVRRRNWGGIGQTATIAMPPLAPSTLLSKLDEADADNFIAEPVLADMAIETGPAARQHKHPLVADLEQDYGNGLLPRLVARLVEIAEIVERPAAFTDAVADKEPTPGFAQLEAARGRLCHRVVLDGHRITRYRILAPTEWNFGPRGPAIQALRGLARADTPIVQAQAELLIHAIDPCVGYRLEVEAA